MHQDKSTLSVIIPAYNEAEFISSTIESLLKNDKLSIEIIVVNNGSTDSTANIARSLGAKVLDRPIGTIAELRNIGAAASTGEIIVFMDADVCVTDKWFTHIFDTIKALQTNPMIVTGSRCIPPQNNNWLNKHWFSHLTNYQAPYINSGHLITTRTLFNRIGGFTETLTTAEDHDFCQKAVRAGAKLFDNPNLTAIHYGYPETVHEFVRREKWHGSGDAETWNSFFNSKVAQAALINLSALFLACFYSIAKLNLYPTIIYIVAAYLFCIALSKYKFSFLKPNQLIHTALIFYLYLSGRSLSLLSKLTSFR